MRMNLRKGNFLSWCLEIEREHLQLNYAHLHTALGFQCSISINIYQRSRMLHQLSKNYSSFLLSACLERFIDWISPDVTVTVEIVFLHLS